MNIITGEKLAPMIKDRLVVIVVVMKERHLQRAGVGLQRPWTKRADDKPIGNESAMDRGWYMIPMAHNGAEIAPVDSYRREGSVPSHRVQRIERVGRDATLASALDDDAPLSIQLLGTKGFVN